MISKFVILILWLFSTIKTTLFHSYFWQLKEYRLDRVIPHLKLKTGQSMIFSPLSLAKWILIFLLLVSPESKQWLWLLILLVFLIESFVFLKKILARELYKPKFTLRVNEIILGALLLSVLGLCWLFVNNVSLGIFALGLLCLERLIVFTVPFQVYLTRLPAFVGKEIKIREAKEKLKLAKNLKVIGVTGSYGKTSTKDFITQVLAKKYKVAKTRGTNNTKIGIAQNILKEIKKDTEIFVVEMGAYKKGEIADICQLIRPHIAVVTGINEQHLAIFGSLKNLIEAKYEIIEVLPQDGVAVFNGTNRYCLQMAQKATKKFKTILYQGKKQELEEKIPLIGQHNLQNILAAIVVAKEMGMKDAEIKAAVARLKPASKGLKEVKGIGNLTFINDTFSSNPHGFLAAIDYLKGFKSKTKIIITPGIIELGSASARVHQEIGQKMRKVANLVILTNNNFLTDIKKGMGEKAAKVIVESRPDRIIAILKEKSPKVVVLLEGRLPAKIINSLKLR